MSTVMSMRRPSVVQRSVIILIGSAVASQSSPKSPRVSGKVSSIASRKTVPWPCSAVGSSRSAIMRDRPSSSSRRYLNTLNRGANWRSRSSAAALAASRCGVTSDRRRRYRCCRAFRASSACCRSSETWRSVSIGRGESSCGRLGKETSIPGASERHGQDDAQQDAKWSPHLGPSSHGGQGMRVQTDAARGVVLLAGTPADSGVARMADRPWFRCRRH